MSNDMREALRAVRWLEEKGVVGEVGSVKNGYWMAISNAIRQSQQAQGELRYTNDGAMAECPCCGSLDVGAAGNVEHCYGCGLSITKKSHKEVLAAWNRRARPPAPAAVPESFIGQCLDGIEIYRVDTVDGDVGAHAVLIEDIKYKAEVIRQSARKPEVPLGAVHNGQVFMDRLENDYRFDCEAGPLSGCFEWQELKRCYEAMAEHILAAPAPAEPDSEE